MPRQRSVAASGGGPVSTWCAVPRRPHTFFTHVVDFPTCQGWTKE